MSSHTMGLFALGMAGTIILVTLFWRDVPYPRSIAVVGGAWATVPQLVVEIPYIGTQLSGFETHWLANVFWFNHLIQQSLQSGGGTVSQHRFTALFLGVLVVTLVWAEWREYRTVERVPTLVESGER